jgi:hypothetical protein
VASPRADLAGLRARRRVRSRYEGTVRLRGARTRCYGIGTRRV